VPEIDVVPGDGVSADERAAIISLCDRAYGESMAGYYAALRNSVHLIGRVEGVIVAHAMWVTRWLQAGDGPFMRAAYVELVATDPEQQGRGYASLVMQRLVGYEIGALSPSERGASVYSRLGWEAWTGPLFARRGASLIATPGETVMVLRLPGTPPSLGLNAPLSVEWRTSELW
jgi:aminoglycoside 2'-N-acetyltransferase I